MGDMPNILDELYSEPLYNLKYKANYTLPKPSIEKLSEIISLIREILFPGYFDFYQNTIKNAEEKLNQLSQLLLEQVSRVLCTEESLDESRQEMCIEGSKKIVNKLIQALPNIRKLLLGDIEAAYEGDPAAKSVDEVILCYPSIKALTSYRIAHEFYKMNVPLIPRLFTEIAHAETGIDIHPGAKIGERFFMDHGTGIVIGETSIIGKNVKIYQGVTLGAKSFPLDESGKPIKGIARHPIVEDNVIIYANATILGRVRIGENSIIGSNAFITRDVPPNSKIFVERRY